MWPVEQERAGAACRLIPYWQTRRVPAPAGGGEVTIGCAADGAVIKLLKIKPGERSEAETLAVLRREVNMSLSLDALRLRHLVKVRRSCKGCQPLATGWNTPLRRACSPDSLYS